MNLRKTSIEKLFIGIVIAVITGVSSFNLGRNKGYNEGYKSAIINLEQAANRSYGRIGSINPQKGVNFDWEEYGKRFDYSAHYLRKNVKFGYDIPDDIFVINSNEDLDKIIDKQ